MAMRSSSLSNKTTTGIEREIGSQYDNVVIVADSISNVNTVAASITNIQNVLPYLSEINAVGSNIVDIVAIAAMEADITSVMTLETEIKSLYADKDILTSLYADKITLDGLYSSKEAIDSLYADKSVLDSLFSDKSTLDSLFTDKVVLDSLYADKAKLDSLYADKNVLDRIYTSIDNLDRVFISADNIDVVAGSVTNIDTVASDLTSINIVADDTIAINEIYANRAEIYAADDNAAIATAKAAEALVSADNAAVSETNANTSAVAASSSATTASVSATSASNSATIAAGHLAAIEGIYDNFDDRYLGAYATDPTADNDGNALVIGAIYFNTTDNRTKFYNGVAWEDPELASTEAAQIATTKANEASASASASETSRIASASAQTAAEVAQTASETAQGLAEEARDEAVVQAGIATTKASEAAVSAANASSSELTATDAAVTATTNANLALGARDTAVIARDEAVAAETFLGSVYLGAYSSAPTTDNNGDSLTVGAVYYNTTSESLQVYTGSVWDPAVFDATGAVLSFNGREGAVTLSNTDVTSAVGQALDTSATPTFASTVINGETLTDTLRLNTVYTEAGTEPQGSVWWNSDEETLDVRQNGAVLQLGQELQVHCRNSTGSTITNGTVVMAAGTLGASGRILIAPYDNTSDIKYVIGVATEDIVNGDDGKVTSFGKVRGVDTQAWAEGSVLYTASNGGLTSIEPTTGIKSAIAFVINSASNGTLMVRVSSHNELIDYNGLLNSPQAQVNKNTAVTGTSALTRHDKILSNLDVIAMDYTSGDLDFVRYSGDDGSTIYYRDVLTYTSGNLVSVKHFNGTMDLITPSGITTLSYDGSDNLVSTSYTE